MNAKSPYLSLALAALLFVGAGCGQQGTVSTKTTSGENAPKTATSDACGNPYYPFKPGLTIAYRVTPFSKAAGDTDYTIRTTGVTGTTASIQVEMTGQPTVKLQADCANGSVAMKGTFDLGAAAQGLKFKTTVVSQSGTFMPANVAAGTTWKNSQTVKMETEGGAGAIAGMGPITSTTTEESKAVGEESVTVPAGTYKAIKVTLTRTTRSSFSGGPAGVKIPEMPPTVSTATEWWVKGIGMVKSVTTGNGATTTTEEAKSVTGL